MTNQLSSRFRGLILALAFAVLAPLSALATEPTDPIQIITPEDLAIRGDFTTDRIQIRAQDDKVDDVKVRVIVYKKGEPVREQQLSPAFEKMKIERDPDVEKHDAAPPVMITAELPAVPEGMLREAGKGVFAQLVRVEAKLRDSDGVLVVEEWVRWRTDGERMELIDAETYSALTDRADISTDGEGRAIAVFPGIEVEVAKDSPVEPVPFDTRVEDRVIPEQRVAPKEFQLQSQFDERDED